MGSCFLAYDIRGRVPDELNEHVAYRIGRAYAAVVAPPGPVAVGYDVRGSSIPLAVALSRGLNDGGIDVHDLGLAGTELVYFAAAQPGSGGGIMVTASHNPADYNGMKLVRAGAVPVSGDSGLREIEAALDHDHPRAARVGATRSVDVYDAYVQAVLALVDTGCLRPLRIVVNAGNGCAGPAFDRLAERLPFEVFRIHHEPDGSFPNGVPNPLVSENRADTAAAVVAHRADFGIAWDGDFDRCFFFDEAGRFIEGYYVVGLLAAQMLERNPGAKIIHDPRLVWSTIETVARHGGTPVQSRTGHAFIKERMRAEDALYGGEMSAHHYFRDFAYCDSGMIPWLLVAERLSRTGARLSELVDAQMRAFPCSGEINFRVADVPTTLARVLEHYAPHAASVDRTDGVSVDFGDWRFNLRGSNTEPMLRLNVETRGDAALLRRRTDELGALIR